MKIYKKVILIDLKVNKENVHKLTEEVQIKFPWNAKWRKNKDKHLKNKLDFKKISR